MRSWAAQMSDVGSVKVGRVVVGIGRGVEITTVSPLLARVKSCNTNVLFH